MTDTLILIPSFNEEEHIGTVINNCGQISRADILVVDDGSTDKTADIIMRAGVNTILHERKLGKGTAIETGFNYIKKLNYEYVIIIDADFQYLPLQIPLLLTELEKSADFVMGYRDWKGVPFRHRIGNLVWRTTFNLCFKTRFKDTNCGFVGFKSKCIDIFTVGKGFTLETSLLLDCLNYGLKITNVPVVVKYYSTIGLVNGIKVVLDVLYYIIYRFLRCYL